MKLQLHVEQKGWINNCGQEGNTGGDLPSGLVPTTLANGEHLPRNIQAASVGHSNDAFAHTQSCCLEREDEGI